MSDDATEDSNHDPFEEEIEADPNDELFEIIEEKYEEIKPSELKEYWGRVPKSESEEEPEPEPEPDKDLMANILKNGQLEPIIVTDKNEIISGTKRWIAINVLKEQANDTSKTQDELEMLAKFKDVKCKCRKIKFKNDFHAFKAMLLLNKHTKKTYYELYHECNAWKMIYEQGAFDRKKITQFNGRDKDGNYRTKGSDESSAGVKRTPPIKGKVIDIISGKMDVPATNLKRIQYIYKTYVETKHPKMKIICQQLEDGDLSLSSAEDSTKLFNFSKKDDKKTVNVNSVETPLPDLADTLLVSVLAKGASAKKCIETYYCYEKRVNREAAEATVMPKDVFNVIYSDPPWQAESMPKANAENHFNTMPYEKIVKVKPENIAKDAIIFLWTTIYSNEEAFKLINDWGFRYKSQMIWDKGHKGKGHWVRSQHEILLIAIKGNMKAPFPTLRYASVHKEPHTNKFGQKPEYYFYIIEQMYPYAHRIEMYARVRREGWEAFGDDKALRSDVVVKTNYIDPNRPNPFDVSKRALGVVYRKAIKMGVELFEAVDYLVKLYENNSDIYDEEFKFEVNMNSSFAHSELYASDTAKALLEMLKEKYKVEFNEVILRLNSGAAKLEKQQQNELEKQCKEEKEKAEKAKNGKKQSRKKDKPAASKTKDEPVANPT